MHLRVFLVFHLLIVIVFIAIPWCFLLKEVCIRTVSLRNCFCRRVINVEVVVVTAKLVIAPLVKEVTIQVQEASVWIDVETLSVITTFLRVPCLLLGPLALLYLPLLGGMAHLSLCLLHLLSTLFSLIVTVLCSYSSLLFQVGCLVVSV